MLIILDVLYDLILLKTLGTTYNSIPMFIDEDIYGR